MLSLRSSAVSIVVAVFFSLFVVSFELVCFYSCCFCPFLASYRLSICFWERAHCWSIFSSELLSLLSTALRTAHNSCLFVFLFLYFATHRQLKFIYSLPFFCLSNVWIHSFICPGKFHKELNVIEIVVVVLVVGVGVGVRCVSLLVEFRCIFEHILLCLS